MSTDVKAQVTDSINSAAATATKSVADHAASAEATAASVADKATAAVAHVQAAALTAVEAVNQQRVNAKHFFATTTGKLALAGAAVVLVAVGAAAVYFLHH